MFTVLGGSLTLFEGAANYRPSEDSFWLASLLPTLPPKSTVLELGCGSGAILLAYAQRVSGCTYTGVDHTPEMIEAAKKAAKANNISATFTEGNALSKRPRAFDLVFANPPFYVITREDAAQGAAKQNTKHTSDLSAWLTALLVAVKPHGYAALICHSKDAEMFLAQAQVQGAHCRAHYTLHSHPEKPAKRTVLIFNNSAGKNAQPERINTYDAALREKALVKNQPLFS